MNKQDYVEWEIVTQDGEWCASSTDLKQAMIYLSQYSEDGPVEIWKVSRQKIENELLSAYHDRFEVGDKDGERDND